ncbi:vWA domain-containing protein [Polyangium mundeleinium]|uniref:VWA domain-containing protein n=1 Tax=Polyangium mundeleinium TaxID=2995306 RepID=A0ABT5EZJ0_9BACT|nr:VWA domain-containing protein [Polyangium mundeleinium]MDC0747196.1 VWA domain-containing protein [Polyangium mundeleinium]
MHFVGVPLATLLQIGALAGSVVVVFYILKLRRRPVAVPFEKLWERILRDKEATSLFSQLKRFLSLLLQLALLALLLLALGDPRPAANILEGRNIIVLVDASASMKATDVAPSRIDAAKEEVKRMVRGLSGSDRMLVAQMDAAVTPLSTMTSEIPDLEAAVASIKATDASADFARGLRFGADTLRGLSSPEIIVVSDGALGPAVDAAGPVELGDVRISFLPIGSRATNVAITGFSVRRYPLDKSRYEVMLEVTNTNDEPVDVELSLFGDGQLTDLSQIRLGPKERLPRFYPNLSGASKTLEAKIAYANGSRDDLPADDHAFALLPERRRSRVQVVTSGNMFLEAALLLDEYLEVTTIDPSRYPAKGNFDVTIFDGVTPNVAAGSGSLLYLNPSGENVPFEVGKPVEDTDPNYRLGFDELDEKHPILRYTVLSDVNIGRARPLKGEKEDKVIGKSYKGPILIAGTRAGVKFVALGFDVRESDFPLRISWPLFLLNTINEFVEEDVQYISSFRTGTVWQIPASSAADTATLELPDGTKRSVPVKDGRAIFLGQQAGFYKLSTGPDETTTFAANLVDPAESVITPATELVVGGRAAGPVGEFKVGVRREIWIYLLAAVLLVTAIEWLTYHRRVTV